jgi:DNA-binding NtrC family response regulator
MTNIRVLIVDDEEVFAKNWVKLLARRGYDATYVVSGADAIAAIDKSIFDVILLDLRMPGLNGILTYKEIIKRDPNTRIILMTAHADIDDALTAVRLGAWGYLRKPFELDEIIDQIEGAYFPKQPIMLSR